MVPVGVQQWANRAAYWGADNLDAALSTFDVGLAPAPEGPATHLWCSWACDDGLFSDLWSRFTTGQAQGYGAQLWDGDTTAPDEVLAQTGLVRVEP